MTTDITELALLRGRTVDYPFYLVECECGEVYPSSELNGGEPIGECGDYSDCTCPHCREGEGRFSECADPETAWKAQQGKIDELVEALEKAKGMETYWKTQCRGITDHCEELQARIAELESHTVKLPDALDFDCEMENGDYDIDEEPYLRGKVDGFNHALTKIRRLNGTAGIKWEDE